MVTIYGTPTCGYCKSAKELCEESNLEYTYIDLFEEDHAMEHLTGLIGPFRTVPQIFVEGEYVGGFTEFKEFNNFYS